MRIDRVYLKNFRTHRELELNFAPGMNLLLGQNGSGKSSVLEAIGITLFDSKFRDGNSTGKDQVIKFGEKEAVIEIEFQGNDEKTYIVQNCIKARGGYYRIFDKENPDEIIFERDEVREKLKVLLGIGGNLGNTYDNIIVAKQNEFINIYKLKGAERKKVFDEIFETDIYDKINRGFSKEVGDRYRSELEKSRAKLETLKGKAEDPREILKELEKSEKSKTSVDQVLREKENIKKSLEKNIDENINLEKSIERTGRDIETEVKILETQKSALISNDKDTLEAEESLKIVRKNSESYESYLEFQKRAGETKEKVIALEDEILNLRKKEMEIKNLEREALEISGEIEKEKIHIATNREKFQKVLELKTEEEKALLLAQNREAELESEEKNLLPLIRKGEVLENEIKNLNYLLEIEEEKSFQDKKLYLEISEKLKLSQKDAIQEKIDMLLKVAEEKTSLESEISKLQALLENSREAEKKLSTSLCPYLNEKCKNLESSSDAEEFFREREKKFTDSLKEKETKLFKVKESLETLDHLKKLKREEEIMLETLLNLGRVIEKRESEIKNSQLQRENLYLQMENFQREGMSLEKLRERKITLIE
ncbi:MAG: AAA family ATPase, partial [Fusobacteriaceae bacterium]